VFLDLFNLSTFLLPRKNIPPLSRQMKTRLSIRDDGMLHHSGNTVDEDDEDDSIKLMTSVTGGNNGLDSSGDSQLSI
jgi:hypothetical protein